MTRFYRLLIILCCFSLLGALNPARLKITGVEGDVLLNIKARLTELYQDKPISHEPVEALQEQIKKAMYPFGFFRPQIAILTPDNLSIHIIPGPQMHITSINVQIQGEGADDEQIKQAVRDLPIKVGQAFNNARYEEAKTNLFSEAEHLGYLHATFNKSEVFIDRIRYTTDITLIFNTGPQYYFGQIRFDPTYISPELLHRYVPFKYGQPYSTQQVLDLNNNLAASGYFNSVVVKPDINLETHVPIDVHMQRVNRINYSLGVGYGTDTGPRGRAGVHIVPVNRSGHKFNAIAQGSMNQNALLAQYLIPGRNPVTDNYAISGSLTNLNYNVGNSNAILLSLAQQHVVTNYQRILSLNALNERFSYNATPKTTKTLFFPKATFTWRKVTDQLFSPSGYNVTLNGLAAGKALLSDVNMAQAGIDIKAALTVDLIRTRFFFHGIQDFTAINDIDNLPLSLATLLGGAENLKAYSFNSIGPGKILTFGGVEIQKETFDKWYFIGFVDSGDVYKPSLKEFKYDAGIGLMWVSPVGPIKVGIAQAIDNHFKRIEGRSPKLVINMGPDL